jgi:hypothetical protein
MLTPPKNFSVDLSMIVCGIPTACEPIKHKAWTYQFTHHVASVQGQHIFVGTYDVNSFALPENASSL